MPELPEVQTIVDDLKERVVGKRIKNVWTDWPKYFRLPKGEINFRRHVIGKKIIGIERRAKNILFDLSDDHLMLIHQKMSGHLLFGKWAMKKREVEKRNPRPAFNGQKQSIHSTDFLFKRRRHALSFGFATFRESFVRSARGNFKFAGTPKIGARAVSASIHF